MKDCIICGKSIEEDTYYCPYCGEFNSCCGLTYENIMRNADKCDISKAMKAVEEHNK